MAFEMHYFNLTSGNVEIIIVQHSIPLHLYISLRGHFHYVLLSAAGILWDAIKKIFQSVPCGACGRAKGL